MFDYASTSKPKLEVCPSPALLPLYNIEESIVVIIDVLRATSTIAAALYNGASAVYPVATVENCVALSREKNGITAGERDGKTAPGLDHGNSPLEYPKDFIEDQILVLTTTNGTRLLHKSLGAQTIITGSFPNISAVCTYLIQQDKPVLLACAGWRDRVNVEDTLFAGAVVNRVKECFDVNCDACTMAESLYLQHENNLIKAVEQSSHYKRLACMGVKKDIEYCLSSDVAAALPLYKSGKLINYL